MADRILQFQDSAFSTHFPDRHFRVAHGLVADERFDLETIYRVARSFPRAFVDCRASTLGPESGLASEAAAKQDFERAIECLETSQSWLQIRHAQNAPEYRGIAVRAFRDVVRQAGSSVKGLQQPVAYVLFSSPGSVTPFHIDDELNFLLQVSGTKTVHTWPNAEPGPITREDLERYYRSGYSDVAYCDELMESCTSFELSPGQGLFIPVHTPHWVENGPEVCVSFSLTFLSNRLQKEANVHWLNARLRQKGLSPAPFTDSLVRDNVKYHVARAWRRVKKRRLRPMR